MGPLPWGHGVVEEEVPHEWSHPKSWWGWIGLAGPNSLNAVWAQAGGVSPVRTEFLWVGVASHKKEWSVTARTWFLGLTFISGRRLFQQWLLKGGRNPSPWFMQLGSAWLGEDPWELRVQLHTGQLWQASYNVVDLSTLLEKCCCPVAQQWCYPAQAGTWLSLAGGSLPCAASGVTWNFWGISITSLLQTRQTLSPVVYSFTYQWKIAEESAMGKGWFLSAATVLMSPISFLSSHFAVPCCLGLASLSSKANIGLIPWRTVLPYGKCMSMPLDNNPAFTWRLLISQMICHSLWWTNDFLSFRTSKALALLRGLFTFNR